MTDSDYAQKRLWVIRSLMERAAVYRSVSALTALVGGLLSFGGFGVAYYAKHHRDHPLLPGEFLNVWLVILALTAFANLVFLWRGSLHQKGFFFFPGMKYVALTLAPVFFSAVMLTFLIHRPIQQAMIWITLYGMALLCTQHFAPRTLSMLGLMFFLTGCGLMATWKHLFMPPGHLEPSALAVSGILAATFGGYHLAYAAAIWALGGEQADSTSSANTTPKS